MWIPTIWLSWDKVYDEELANFEELGDEGEIWWVQTSTSFIIVIDDILMVGLELKP